MIQSTIGSRVDPDIALKEQQRRMATIHSGYAFIILELIDYTKWRISGVDELISKPTEKRGKYIFEVVQRQLQFAEDSSRGGTMTAYVLDTKHNREFIASHLDSEIFTIVGVISGRSQKLTLAKVIDEIDELKEEMAKKYVEVTNPQPPVLEYESPIIVNEDEIQNVPEELLKQELERREQLKNNSEGMKEVPMGALVKKEEIELRADMSEEEYQKLSRGQKSYVTRLRREAQNTIHEDHKESDIIIDTDDISEDILPDSPLLSPTGMVQP